MYIYLICVCIFIICIVYNEILLRYLTRYTVNEIIINSNEYYINKTYPDTDYTPEPNLVTLNHQEFNDMIHVMKQENKFLQQKIKFDSNHNLLLNILLRIFIWKWKMKNIDTYVLRVATTPHRILSHFDCRYSYLLMLYGRKHVVTFKLDEYSLEEQEAFLKTIKYMNVEQLVTYFKKIKMKHKHSIISTNNCLFLEPLEYHYIESINDTEYTILLNMDLNPANDALCDQCDEQFDKQYQNIDWYSSS